MVMKFSYKGKSLEELRSMSLEEFSRISTSSTRRSLKRGFTEEQKKLMKNVRSNPGKFHKTHCREMIIIPEFIGVKFGIYNGKEYIKLDVRPEMIGHRFGEFSHTRKMVKHSSPGFGATKSSKFVPLK